MAPWDNDIHTPQDGTNILWQLFVFMELEPALLFYDNQYTEYESRNLEIGVSPPIFTHKNINGSIAQQYPYSV